MKAYKELLRDVYREGEAIVGRNGATIALNGMQFKHDLSRGFPILTLRKMSIANAMTELRFFLSGNTNKQWLKDRGNHFWDKFCNKNSYEYGQNREFLDEKEATEITNDLGPIYGAQWRNFNSSGYDQLAVAIETLKKDPLNRRIFVSAWNPLQLNSMALPPCHDSFQFLSNGAELDLIWRQRSCDVVVGLPYDILLYGLMLTLIAKEVKMIPRFLIGQLGSTHIYEQNMRAALAMLARDPKILPELFLPEYGDLSEIISSDLLASIVSLSNYNSHPAIKVELVA